MTTITASLELRVTFEDLFLTQYARVVGVARRIVGESAAAQDVAQEVFAAFALRMRPDDAGASAWLCVTAARMALNEVRRRGRANRRERAQSRLELARLANCEADTDPARIVDREEERRLVRRAMSRLPERFAMLLALRYGGLSYREIARTLRLPEAQVGTYLARAQRAFAKEITDVESR